MARIVDSLKNFYKKQGGTPSDVRGIKSISGVIDKIANLSLGSSSYEFDFDITQDGSAFIATARAGVTYEAITAALAKTPNVYFNAHFQTGNTLRTAVNYIQESSIAALGTTYMSDVLYYNLNIGSDNISHINTIPLTS